MAINSVTVRANLVSLVKANGKKQLVWEIYRVSPKTGREKLVTLKKAKVG